MRVSVIVPAHNEEDNIQNVIKKIQKMKPDQIVVVDDCSEDGTYQIAKSLSGNSRKFTVISRKGNPGFKNALEEGFKHANGDILIPVMADMCDNLADIPKMVKKISSGYDIVGASRYIPSGRSVNSPGFKKFLSMTVGFFAHHLASIPIYDSTNAFKAYRREVLDDMRISSKSFDISFEIVVKANINGFRMTEIPTIWRGRTKGYSKFRLFENSFAYIYWILFGFYFRLISRVKDERL